MMGISKLREGIGPTGMVTWANRVYTNTWLINNAEAICDLIEAAEAEVKSGPCFEEDSEIETPYRNLKAALKDLKGK